jgi:WXG100 family type VII secretion target
MSDGRMWMDTQQARGHAGKINQGVSEVQGLIDQITGLLDGIYWQGEDRERFMAQWEGELKPTAGRVVQQLQDSADELNRRADEQDALSQRGY